MNNIPVIKIVENPNQPRQTYDETSIAELADSMRANGLLQPILVEDNQDGTYTLVGGHRRRLAAQKLGWETIPATVRERTNHGGRELLIHAIVENVQREDMNPVDEALAYQRLRDEHGMTWIEVAQAVGKQPGYVSGRAILARLETEIQELIKARAISSVADVARALLAIPNAQARLKLAQKAAQEHMGWKQIIAAAESLAEKLKAAEPDTSGKIPALRLAQKKTGVCMDEDVAPPRWNAMAQVGLVPPWNALANAASVTCQHCALYPVANATTCRDCPMIEFMIRVVRHAA